MTISASQLDTEIFYPSSDGTPMAESDAARDYLIYGVEALSIYFQNQDDVYVSGNLFVYYKKGVPDAVVAPDVLVIKGVEKKQRMSYKVWEENGKVPDFVMEVTSKTTQENDDEEKPQKYQKMGVSEYFQYDPTGDYLKQQLKGSRLVEGKYQALTPRLLPDGVLSIHSEVLGLDLRLLGKELRFYEPVSERRLLSPLETEQARQQAEQARQQAEQTIRNAVPRLIELGLSEEQVAQALGLSVETVRQMFP
jgi:Uma2 family endonuclease